MQLLSDTFTVINVLPLPSLNGGCLALLIYEAVRG